MNENSSSKATRASRVVAGQSRNGKREGIPKNGKAPLAGRSSGTDAANDQAYGGNGTKQAQSHDGSEQKQVAQFCAVHPAISTEAITELIRRGVLHLDGEYWRFGDQSNPGVTRSLNDLDFKHSHTSGNTWHGLIGLCDVVENDRREAWLVIEGSKDALAAAEIVQRRGVLRKVGILAALGSGYRPIRAELEKLCSRKVMVIGDNDAAGRDTTQIVSSELTNVGVEHVIWNWNGDGSKDLYEWLMRADARAAFEGWVPGVIKNNFLGVNKNNFFLPSSPSDGSTVHPFTRSTNIAPAFDDREMRGIIAPFIVTQKGTANRQAFLLARAIKGRDFDLDIINKIFRLWFVKSRPLLKPKANEDEALAHFYKQLTRVRFTPTGLEAACERARKATLPEIPKLAHNQRALRLATLCRELQRESGARAFICPVNVAQQFLELPHAPQANYVLHVLEQHKVLECVDRGAPNKEGVKGKPTFWRYKLVMEEEP